LTGAYTFGAVKAGGAYHNQDYDLGPGVSSTKKAWRLGATWAISGPHGVEGSYTKSNDISGNGGAIAGAAGNANPQGIPAAGVDTGANIWSVAYTHRFSKRTDGKLGYVRLNNDANASYNLFNTVNTGFTAAEAAGKSQSAWIMFLRHTF